MRHHFWRNLSVRGRGGGAPRDFVTVDQFRLRGFVLPQSNVNSKTNVTFPLFGGRGINEFELNSLILSMICPVWWWVFLHVLLIDAILLCMIRGQRRSTQRRARNWELYMDGEGFESHLWPHIFSCFTHILERAALKYIALEKEFDWPVFEGGFAACFVAFEYILRILVKPSYVRF